MKKLRSSFHKIRKISGYFLIACFMIYMPQASAFTTITGDSIDFSFHPFQENDGFYLYDQERSLLQQAASSKSSLKDVVSTIISNHIPEELDQVNITVSLAPKNDLSLYSSQSEEFLTAGLQINGIPFCEYEVKAVLDSLGNISMLGRIPNLADSTIEMSSNWPSLDKSWERGQKELVETTSLKGHPELISSKKCYHIFDSKLVEIWKIVGRIAGYSYTLLTDSSQVYQISPLFFNVEGSIQSYRYNASHGELVTYKTNLVGDGFLRSVFFETNTDSAPETAVPEAFSDEHIFIYNPDEPEFTEATAFMHATNMLAYFQELGYKFTNTKPILLEIHAILSGTVNNGLYQPPEATAENQAIISVGDGDGIILQNLPTDSDVISHELGHHIVFEKLKATTGESLVIHEAMADFFAFSYNSDPCLGESICPVGSNICVIEAGCLRTAESGLVYNSEEYNSTGAHHKSQMFSGLLWNVGQRIGLEKTTNIAFKSLDYFVIDTGFKDFLVSLLLADQYLNQGENACVIYDEATAKGLTGFLTEIECDNANTWLAPGSETPSVPSAAPKDSSSKSNIPGCGTVGLHNGHSSGIKPFILFILFALPLLMMPLSRRFSK
ncbi:MAG: hypothetical protein HRU09_18030 [Oligoflexales bacterium]|nr:hypothetical protein [Oligoflexales bacterium]